MRRVVVTGIGMITPFGDQSETFNGLLSGKTCLSTKDELREISGLRSLMAGTIDSFDYEANLKCERTMGRVAKLAAFSTKSALSDSGLYEDPIIGSGALGIAYGSGNGAYSAYLEAAKLITEKRARALTTTSYHRGMSHTCAVNIGLNFGITGRIVPTSSACTSGSQAVGYAYEAIKNGYQEVMIAGGAEEFNPMIATLFDVLFASSTGLPKPFSKNRDGMVVAEGACSLILESLDRAEQRDARVYGEIVGFHTNSDGYHMTNPKLETTEVCVRRALEDAKIEPKSIDYVCAHATGTVVGDSIEAELYSRVFGDTTKISSLKGHLGHTLGACGAIEIALTLKMMNQNTLIPTLGLEAPIIDSLNLLRGEPISSSIKYAMKNTFAFGGINTAIVLKSL